MGSEQIDRTSGELSVTFNDSKHDVLMTGLGRIDSVRRIVLSNADTCYREGTLFMHIHGDPNKAAITELSFNSTFVTAISFADLTSGIQRSGQEPQGGDGEVAVILLMDVDMPDSSMARAGITSTEAITAAIQDLGIAYDGIAGSGSAVQNIAVVRCRDCGLFLRGAGKHTKLGELIGRSVLQSVKESADLNGTSVVNRMSSAGMLAAYGYDQGRLFKLSGCPDMNAFLGRMIAKDSEPKALASVSAVLNICNQVNWGLISEEEGRRTAEGILRSCLRDPVGNGDTLEVLASTLAYYFMDP